MSEKIPSTPDSYINAIVHSPGFLPTLNSALNGESYSSLPEHVKAEVYSRAVGSTALLLVQEKTRPSGYREREANIYDTIGQMDSFVDAQIQLDLIEERKAAGEKIAHDAKMPFLEQVIPFNHAVSEIIDHDAATLDTNTLIDLLTKTYYMKHRGEGDVRYFNNALRRVVYGMQHEVLFEQIIRSLSDRGVQYQTTSEITDKAKRIQREIKGIDGVALVDGVRLDIDIKKSPLSEQKARQKNSVKSNKLILWSGVTPQEAGTKFRLPLPIVERKSDILLSRLQEASRLVA